MLLPQCVQQASTLHAGILLLQARTKARR